MPKELNRPAEALVPSKNPGRHYSVPVGGIISFWWATSFRYDGRHHLVLVGDIVRNQHVRPLGPALSALAGLEPVPSDVQEKLVHEVLDQHYRARLDEPTPMLAQCVARAAARTARGREDLVVWLKHLENRSRHATGRNDPVATYDFTWMWREVNVDHLRN